MKKYFSFAMALVAMLAMVSASSGCSDDGVDYSVTIVAKTTLSLSKNAGTGRLAYEIQGADKSSIVEATTNVDWIKNFNYAEPGYVQFDYTALDEGVESRSGQITLSYTGAADVVVTVNQGGTMTFELTIDPKSITANGCAMQIVPSNESETYLCAFMTKEYVDSFESDEAFIQADLEAVKEQAESRGMKLSEWLNILLMKGSKTNTVDDLSLANTAYYGYVYGCTSEGVPTTDLFKAEFTTQNVEMTDLTFTVTSKQVNADPYPDNNPYNVEVTITPSNPDAKWMFSTMNSYVYKVDEWTSKEYLQELQSSARKQRPTLYQGEQKFMLNTSLKKRVWGGNDYYFWCFGMDDNYNINSENAEEYFTVTTGEIPVTDNCTFTVEKVNVTAQDCEIKITPSNLETRYFIGMYPGGSAEKYGKSVCVERLLQRLDMYNSGSGLGDGTPPNWQTNKWVQKGEMTTKMGADQEWRIEPESTYEIFIFGFDKYGHRTTDVSVTEFTTPEYVAPTDFKLEFEFSEIEMRSFTCKVTPSHDDVWYHVGIINAEVFDSYNGNWLKFLDDLIHGDGGGDLSQYVGEEILSTDCTPGTQYVAYGFAYASGTYQSDLSTGRVESKPLPRNDNATVSGTWQVYNGDELAARYPSAWKDYKGVQYVCVYQAEPTSEETAHTWVFVHAPRGGDLPLPDMLIFDYFENYPFVAIYKDAKHGRCSPPGVGPWGFYYAGQDETGAWGPLDYETIMMNDPDHQGDIDTAPTDGFDDKREDKSSVSTVSKVSLSAPIRFSQASFIQIERERMDHGKATIFNTPKKEATVNVDFDVDAQLKNITDNIR
ncbi:hypothetical protein [Alistipes putredinis]|uniref:hypothetical protein n=1 Tax=Alistipes putredinis TaxID=28117 RepID=UPI00242E47AA|nr:hypothetical protein [Alistipes putredinis]